MCGKVCESKKQQRQYWRLAATMEIKEIVQKRCKERLQEKTDDEGALEVVGRVIDCFDFVTSTVTAVLTQKGWRIRNLAEK